MIKNVRMDNINIFVNCYDSNHYDRLMEHLANYKINQDYLILKDINGHLHFFSGGKENIDVEELEKVYG